MFKFYQYTFYKIYSFFEKLKSRNPHSSALGILTVPEVLLVFKIHALVSWHFFQQELRYAEIAILYVILFIVLYAVNYYVLMNDSKYLKLEGFFERKEYPRYYERLLPFITVLILVVLIL